MGSRFYFSVFLDVLLYSFFLANQTENRQNRRLWTFKLSGMDISFSSW